MNQLAINYTGKELKEKGMLSAEKHANQVNKGWSDSAYYFFKYWIRYQDRPFKMETFRDWVKDMLPIPPSLRAFGSIVVKAKKENLIKHAGYTQVSNPKARQANCSLWQRV